VVSRYCEDLLFYKTLKEVSNESANSFLDNRDLYWFLLNPDRTPENQKCSGEKERGGVKEQIRLQPKGVDFTVAPFFHMSKK